jgi:hypothetical protein
MPQFSLAIVETCKLKPGETVIASDSEATQTKPQLETHSLGRFALLAMTERAVDNLHDAPPIIRIPPRPKLWRASGERNSVGAHRQARSGFTGRRGGASLAAEGNTIL